MPYSYINYTGDGSNTTFTFPFPYILPAHVVATINGVVVPYSFSGPSTVIVTPAPFIGSTLQVRRVSVGNTAPTDFSDGSVLLESDLDRISLYTLYTAQECYDRTLPPTGGGGTGGGSTLTTAELLVLLAGAITTTELAAGAVTANDIAIAAITDAALADGSISGGKIVASSLTATQLAAGTITGSRIAAGTIAAANIAANTITAAQVAAGTLTATQIATASLTANLLVANTITAAQIAAGTITGTEVAANSITATNIDSRSLTIKDALGNVILSAGAVPVPLSPTYITPSAAWLNANVTMSAGGVLSGAGGGTVTIGGLGFTGDLAATNDLPLVVGSGMAQNGGLITKTAATAAWDSQVYSRESHASGAVAVFTAHQTDKFIAVGLNTDPLTNADYTGIDFGIYLNNTGAWSVIESNTFPYGPIAYAAGDVFTITYDGANVRYYQNGAIQRTVAAAAGLRLFLDTSFFTNAGSIRNLRFGPYGSPSAVSPTNQITSANITTFMAAAAIQDAQIGNLNASKITAGSIATARIAAGTVSAAQMVTGTITAASAILADAAVTTAKIADLAVGTAKITDLNVSTLKIAGNAVTQGIGAYTAAATGSIIAETTVQTNTITSSGAPIFILVGTELRSTVGTGSSVVTIRIKRAGTTIATFVWTVGNLATTGLPVSFPALVDTPGAGTYAYTLTVQKTTSFSTITSENRSIFLLELKK